MVLKPTKLQVSYNKQKYKTQKVSVFIFMFYTAFSETPQSKVAEGINSEYIFSRLELELAT